MRTLMLLLPLLFASPALANHIEAPEEADDQIMYDDKWFGQSPAVPYVEKGKTYICFYRTHGCVPFEKTAKVPSQKGACTEKKLLAREPGVTKLTAFRTAMKEIRTLGKSFTAEYHICTEPSDYTPAGILCYGPKKVKPIACTAVQDNRLNRFYGDPSKP